MNIRQEINTNDYFTQFIETEYLTAQKEMHSDTIEFEDLINLWLLFSIALILGFFVGCIIFFKNRKKLFCSTSFDLPQIEYMRDYVSLNKKVNIAIEAKLFAVAIEFEKKLFVRLHRISNMLFEQISTDFSRNMTLNLEFNKAFNKFFPHLKKGGNERSELGK